MKSYVILATALIFSISFSFPFFSPILYQYSNYAYAHEEAVPVQGKNSHTEEQAGIEEHLGNVLPLDLQFTDTSGAHTTLLKLIDRPCILVPVYLSCTSQCPVVLVNLATTLREAGAGLSPMKDYRVITISFDEKDTSADAAAKKNDVMQILGAGFPADAWTFLTGSSENIRAITNAAGFRAVRRGKDFLHPTALIIVSPHGKIIRYLYGPSHQPFSISMALAEAEKEMVGISVRKVLSYCYTYDRKKQTYGLNFIRIGSLIVTGVILIFLAIIILSGKKNRKGTVTKINVDKAS